MTLRLPAQQAATLAGFLAAFAYTLLAGFAVPAQRTLYMLGVVAAARLLKREVAVSNVLALALLAGAGHSAVFAGEGEHYRAVVETLSGMRER